MRRKKTSSILVCLCYFFILLLFCGCSSSLIENYLFEYSILENGTYEVSLKKTSLGYTLQREVKKLEIPAIHKGKPVTKIADRAFHFCFKLEKITIPDSVTSIGDEAFYSIQSLTNIEIPRSITEIGEKAFFNCQALTSMTIPASVTSIGEDAFLFCNNLKEVRYEGNLTDWCNISFADSSSNPFAYAENFYIGDKLLTELIVSNEITEIKKYAFSHCHFKNVSIPDSVTQIDNDAFYMTSIETATIPVSAYSTLQYSLDAKKLKTLTLTSGAIEDYAFQDCDSLENVIFGEAVTKIGSFAFQDCDSLIAVTIPSSITFIGQDAFLNCASLKNVYITDIVAWCNISFATKGANPLCCGASLHLDGELVADLIIPNSITSIGWAAFYNCDSLKSVTIPNSVTSIDCYAFANCSSLTSLTLGDSLQLVYPDSFEDCNNLRTVTIPSSINPFHLRSLSNLDEQAYNEYGNAYYLGNETNKYLVLIKAKDPSISNCTIHENTKIIASFAFRGCNNLTSITIPNSVTIIGSKAFDECNSLASATFENKNGWYFFTESSLTNKQAVSKTDLEKNDTAAKCLTKKTFFPWIRYDE